MGVRFLESFLENESQNACYQVYIPDIVREFRKRTCSVPVVVVDGMSCLRPLYKKFSWLNGGQYKEFYDLVQKFIINFTRLGCELVVYFDGPVQEVKLPVWIQRRLSSGEEISAVFDNLQRGSVFIENHSRTSCLPNGLGWIFLYLISLNKNCQVKQSIQECDEEIARYALKNKCFAILAQDSDYVIYNSAEYYLSIKNLDLEEMTTFCYNSFNLSRDLGIHLDNLPLFASLMGNDIIPYELLRFFHNSLKRNARGRINIVVRVADYIRHLRYTDLSHIAMEVFRDVNKTQLLWKSISSYDLQNITEELKDKEETFTNDNNWKRIMISAKEKYLNSFNPAPLYDIVIKNRFFSSTCLEDYRPRNIIIPVGNVLKNLRQFIYGILLFEKPYDEGKTDHYVSELVMTGFQSMDNAVLVKPKYLEKVSHPGLITLWTSTENHIQELRWEILGEVFRAETSALKRIPPNYLVPVLATRYFIDQYPSLADWELDALIATNVCVKYYSSKDLAQLPSDPLNYKQIWIFTSVTRIYSNVKTLLFAIGDPIALEYLIPHMYTDGKLFHEKYRQSAQKASHTQLCENQVESIEMFNQLKYIILS